MNWAKILKFEEDRELDKYREHHKQLEKLAKEIKGGYGSLGYQGDEINEILQKALEIMDGVIEDYSNPENWDEKGQWIG